MSIVQDTPIYRFGDFSLDISNRELLFEEERLDLNARYFDALALLVREHGLLVEKDRFFEEVWEDVVVSDSALTQCIKEIRRLLGDDASNPRFIQTVPRHGYRFVAEVSIKARRSREDAPDPVTDAPEAQDDGPDSVTNASESRDDGPISVTDASESRDDGPDSVTHEPGSQGDIAASGPLVSGSQGGIPDTVSDRSASRRNEREGSTSAETDGFSSRTGQAGRDDSAFSTAIATALAATLGGAVAGLFGGMLYGFGLAYSPVDQELGTASVLLVLISLTAFLGTVGGFGIGAGMAAAEYAAGGRTALRILGAVLGGMLVGGSVKLLGVDAFNLLFGRTPAGITGGLEGAALGLAVGLGARLGGGLEAATWWRTVAAAAATGAVIGVLIALSGGHLLGGSLDLLARSFSESRLQLDAFGRYFGEVRFGETTQIVLAGIEGLIFTGCVVGALVASRQSRKLLPANQSSTS